jgi:hypothetical protein
VARALRAVSSPALPRGNPFGGRGYGGGRVRVYGCSPGCLVASLVLSVFLTVLVNVFIRVFD